ncbi:unnamed protein product [Rhizoctonia solani]|uniref:Uncharacterized protein n=1 Tax=Rhizoctonia solani TaxID=456999 RepID=A0A8H2Y2G0_9AGAM|nr:unnamed protein product [Rhizoctonia solani]
MHTSDMRERRLPRFLARSEGKRMQSWQVPIHSPELRYHDLV